MALGSLYTVLFLAGLYPVTVIAGRPKWIVVLGLILAVAGELSWFHFISPKMLFLIPPSRFPGFIWIIAVGFSLPKAARPAEVTVTSAVAA